MTIIITMMTVMKMRRFKGRERDLMVLYSSKSMREQRLSRVMTFYSLQERQKRQTMEDQRR